MTQKQKNNIRKEILAKAAEAGIKNASQFGDLAVKLKIGARSHAVLFYNGKSDITTAKASAWLHYFAKKYRDSISYE